MATLGARTKSARRAAQRRIAELNFQLENASNSDTQTEISRRITRMEDLIKQTRMYEGGKRIVGRTVEQRESAVTELEDLNKGIKLSRGSGIAASNRVFRENVREVSRGNKIDVMSEGEMRTFFRATQESWGGSDSVKDRFRAIQKDYGQNLQSVFDAASELNADLISLLADVEEGKPLDKEQKALYGTLMRNDDEMEKRYRKDDPQSPVIGRISSNIRKMDIDTYKDVVKLMEQKRAGKIDEETYDKIMDAIRASVRSTI